MVEPGIDKCGSDVAKRTVLRGRQVGCMLAGRVGAVVTGLAVVRDAGVVEHRRHKGATGHVADAAILGRRHVIRLCVLTRGIDAVMTGVTPGCQNLGTRMVDKCIGETGRVVAHGAITTGVLMDRCIGCLPGADQSNVRKLPVMAGDTVSGDTLVSKTGGCESVNRMTAVTILRRRYVIDRLSVETGS